MDNKDFLASLPRKRCGVGVVFRNGDKILMLKPSYKKYQIFPGGVIEYGEAPWEGAKREIKEELNIVGDIKLASVAYVNRDEPMGDALYFIYDGGERPDLLDEIQFTDGEIVEANWYSREEIAKITTEINAKRASLYFKYIETGEVTYGDITCDLV